MSDKQMDTLMIWNQYVTTYPIHASDFQDKSASFFIQAYLAWFETIGIESDVILRGPLINTEDQSDEHAEYYAGLMPAINTFKAMKETVLKIGNKQQNLEWNAFLTGINFPNEKNILPILKLLTNYLLFTIQRNEETKVQVDGIYQLSKDIDDLLIERDELKGQENEISAENAERAERMVKYEEELELCNKQLQVAFSSKQELIQESELLNKQYKEVKRAVEQKKALLESIQKDNAKLQNEIVSDADDVREQKETAIHTEKKAIEKTKNLQQVYNYKNSLVNNLAMLKKKLEYGTNILDDLINLAAQFREVSMTDLNDDSDEIDLLNMQKELANKIRALESVQNEIKKDDEEHLKKMKKIHNQLQAAQLEEKQAEILHANILNEKKSDAITELQTSTIKLDTERKRILDEVKDKEIEFRNQIQHYEEMVKRMIDSTEEEIKRRFE